MSNHRTRNRVLQCRQPARVWLVVIAASLSIGCQRTSLSDGLTDRQDCSACHGSSTNAAPPTALNGASTTTDIGVGAHQAHLIAGHVAAPVACVECHPLPSDRLTHPDPQGRPAQVTFGSLARLYGASPTWDRTAATCSDTYCHGSKLSGAEQRTAPVWTRVDGTQRFCSSCHGFPPGDNHPSTGACKDCHGEVIGSENEIIDLNRHINGTVDFYVPPPDGGMSASNAASNGGAAQPGVP